MSGVCIGQKRELGSLRLELEAVCELPVDWPTSVFSKPKAHSHLKCMVVSS